MQLPCYNACAYPTATTLLPPAGNPQPQAPPHHSPPLRWPHPTLRTTTEMKSSVSTTVAVTGFLASVSSLVRYVRFRSWLALQASSGGGRGPAVESEPGGPAGRRAYVQQAAGCAQTSPCSPLAAHLGPYTPLPATPQPHSTARSP